MVKLKPLPDIFPRNKPRILFIGTSPGKRSSLSRHYYAGNSNIFWKLIFEAGLTKKLLKSSQDRQLTHYGFGLTDVIKEPTLDQAKIKDERTLKDILKLHKRLLSHKPKIAAFVGKKGYRIFSRNKGKLEYGFQYRFNEDTIIFLLPSTSGQSYGDTNYTAKLKWFKELTKFL